MNSTIGTYDNIIQELLDKNMVLLPLAIDPFGHWGPIARTLLTGNGTNTIYTFPDEQPQHPVPPEYFVQQMLTGNPTKHDFFSDTPTHHLHH
jgi:hypothetical protein